MKKGRILLAAAIVLSALLSGCQANTGDPAAVMSVAEICGIGSVGRVDRFSGMVVARSEVSVKKENEKRVAEVKVAAGDTVTTGQILFSYEQEQAEMDLEKARLELEQLRNSLSSYKAEKEELERQRAKAKADQQLSYTLEISEKDASIRETEYAITAKEKDIEKLENSLKNLDVYCPVDGVVQSVNETGAMDNYGNEKPFIVITEAGNRRIKGYVNETNIGSVNPDMPVVIRSRVDDATWRGTISMIDFEAANQGDKNKMYYSAADDTQSSSKYPFYVELESDEGLILGQHVYIEPDYGQEDEPESDALMLPAYYVVTDDGRPYVWARGAGDKLEKRAVTLGDLNEDTDAYPILSGLTPEDAIAFPAENLKNGMPCVEGGFVEPDPGYMPEEGFLPDGGFEGDPGFTADEGFMDFGEGEGYTGEDFGEGEGGEDFSTEENMPSDFPEEDGMRG